MTVERTTEYLHGLFRELLKLPKETEWVEFKKNNAEPALIGEYISALANASARCLKYVNRRYMNNGSLRERFGIDAKNSAMVSRIIKETSAEKVCLIKLYDPEAGNKAKRYVPWWA